MGAAGSFVLFFMQRVPVFAIVLICSVILLSKGMHKLGGDLPLPLPSYVGRGANVMSFILCCIPFYSLFFFSLASACLRSRAPTISKKNISHVDIFKKLDCPKGGVITLGKQKMK